MQRFEDQVALITGAAGGIGQATAIRLASEGAAVFCVDLDTEGLKHTVATIETANGKAFSHTCDVSDEQAVINTIATCMSTYGKINHVSNMAGILRFDHLHETKIEDFQKIMQVNVGGTFLVCKHALPELIKSKGNIVNAASTSTLAGVPWAGIYSASKGAVLAMTKSMSIEYCKQGVRANCVCPGDIITGMASPSFPNNVDMKLMDRCMSPTGRRGPEVVASVIAMLASSDGEHITGEDIRVDGGTLS
ncbi:MAG: SDR family oxidoreductase [Pseudomonadota bacterium]|nr:SDR family oxidoreductase [Pseudomonadota bacterium]